MGTYGGRLMMTRSRSAFVLFALSWLIFSTQTSGMDAPSSEPQVCPFDLLGEPGKPTVVGPSDIVRRVKFLPQATAPLRILRIDFTGSALSISGSLKFHDTYALEVVNVSNRVITGIHPFVQILTAGGGAMGGGPIVREPIAPGERRWIRNEGRTRHGTAPAEDDVRIRVSIALAGFDTCTWEDRRWADGFSTVPDRSRP